MPWRQGGWSRPLRVFTAEDAESAENPWVLLEPAENPPETGDVAMFLGNFA